MSQPHRSLAPQALQTLAALGSALALAATGCGADDSSGGGGGGAGGGGSSGISQAGAQDFGLFRQILEAGELPAPETIDDLGFFAEHKLDYPPAACGEDLCLHAQLGAMGNLITGSSCTVIQIGLNTPIDPDTLERPPLDLVLAIDVSGSMRGDPIAFVQIGLSRMLDYLEPDDRVSLVTYATHADVLAEAVGLEDKATLDTTFRTLEAAGNTNIYDGLFTAFALADTYRDQGRQARVVLLSDGVATTGILDTPKMQSLAAAYARTGVGLTTIGVGADFSVDLMRGLAEVGAGNFYFLEDPAAVREVFTEEVEVFLHPVALDVQIDVVAGRGYTIRAAYGTNGWRGGLTGGVIDIPTLFVAGRTSSADPVGDGRRGGGGAILLELMPAWSLIEAGRVSPDQLGRVGEIAISWTDPTTGERHTQDVLVDNPHDPGEWPDGGYFVSKTVEKAFVMLNALVGFQMAAALAVDSDPGAARGVLESLAEEIERWLLRFPDPDISDDLTYIRLFIENLAKMEIQTPVSAPPEPWALD